MTASSLFQLLTRGVEDVSVNTILINFFSRLFFSFSLRICMSAGAGLLWVSAKI